MERNPNKTAREIASETLDRIAAELKVGRSAVLTHYLAASSRFRSQSWSNVLLIASQRPEATQVAGRRAWQSVGRTVRRGETGILLVAPLGRNPSGPRPSPSGFNEDPFAQVGARAAFVFDVSQTDGKPIAQVTPVQRDPWACVEKLQALVAKRAAALNLDWSAELARRVSDSGEIRSSGVPPVRRVSALAHELAHLTLHQRPAAARSLHDTVEAQAHGIAEVVACRLGFETHTKAGEYIALACRDRQTLAQTLSVIHDGAAQILEAVVPEQMSSPAIAGGGAEDRLPVEAERFAEIHRAYGDRLIESLAGFVRDRDRAEDITARAFAKAWEKREAFRGEASVRTWIEAIARNDARKSWSRERSFQFDSIDRTDARELSGPELVTDELERREDHLRLQQALQQLPAKQRRALVAHFVDGLSIREIAGREQVPYGTVLSRIFKGKQLLSEAWNAPLAEPHLQWTARNAELVQPQHHRKSREPEPSQDPSAKTEGPEPARWDR